MTHNREIIYASSKPYLDEYIRALRAWLGPSTLRNTWTMRDEPGVTIFHVFRKQHCQHVMREALAFGFPIEIRRTTLFALHWPNCHACMHEGSAHTAEKKCLFGSTTYR
jgi:hypothetical protein